MGLFDRDREFDRIVSDGNVFAQDLPTGERLPNRFARALQAEQAMSPPGPQPVEAVCRLHAAMELLKNGGDRGKVILPRDDAVPAMAAPSVKMPAMQRWDGQDAQSVEMNVAVFSTVRRARLAAE